MQTETPVNTIIIVIFFFLVIPLFVGLVWPGIIGKSGSSKINATHARLQRLSASVESYNSDVGKLPVKLDDLLNNIDKSESWDGPYIRSSLLKDSWGNHFIYESRGTVFEIKSLGADNELGGDNYNADLAVKTEVSG